MADALSLPAGDDRSRVVVFLAVLTSDVGRAAGTPVRERRAFELCRLWVEELYVPGYHTLDGIRGDRDPDAVARFEDAFSADEEAALERFHHFLLLRLGRLPAEARRAGRFPLGDRWRQVVRDASYLLDLLDPDPEALRRRLAGLVESLWAERRPNPALQTSNP